MRFNWEKMKELKAIKCEPSQKDLAQKDSGQQWDNREWGKRVKAKRKFQKHLRCLFGKATATSGWTALLEVRRDTLPSRTLVSSPSLSSCWAPEQVSKERQTTHLASALFILFSPARLQGILNPAELACVGDFWGRQDTSWTWVSSRTSGFCAFLLAADAKILFILQPLEFILFQVP